MAISETISEAPSTAPFERLHAIQWIRALLTLLVIAHHAAEPYVAVGGDWAAMVNDPARSDLLLTLFVFNRTFFMGFFFLISAYFLDASIARHGLLGVAWRRLFRLGVPIVFIVVLVFGGIGYAIYGEGQGFLTFLFRDYLADGDAEFGHLWFIAHLLIYILFYLALRAVFPGLGQIGADLAPPGHGAILVFVLGLGAVTACVRLFWPIDEWTRLLGLVPGEPAHMPFYVALFAAGILAGRAGWFTRLQARVALPWALAATVAFAGLAIWATPSLAQPDTLAMRMAWAFLEPAIGVGIILGLVIVFRRFFAESGRLLPWIEGNLYGIYLVHLFVVIALQIALVEVDLPALEKFAVVVAATIAVSVPMVALLRRVPGIRAVL